MDKLEEQFYAVAAQEIATNNLALGLMAKAFSDCGGSAPEAQARYIKLRVAQLREEYSQQAQESERAERQRAAAERRERATAERRERTERAERARAAQAVMQSESERARQRRGEETKRARKSARAKRSEERRAVSVGWKDTLLSIGLPVIVGAVLLAAFAFLLRALFAG
jgi:cobalamin biosynthesis Mg chelatase CobN